MAEGRRTINHVWIFDLFGIWIGRISCLLSRSRRRYPKQLPGGQSLCKHCTRSAGCHHVVHVSGRVIRLAPLLDYTTITMATTIIIVIAAADLFLSEIPVSRRRRHRDAYRSTINDPPRTCVLVGVSTVAAARGCACSTTSFISINTSINTSIAILFVITVHRRHHRIRGRTTPARAFFITTASTTAEVQSSANDG